MDNGRSNRTGTPRVLLFILGAPLLALGLWRLLDPIGFFDNSGLELAAQAGWLNDARATGGMVVATALVVLLGGVFPRMTYTSTVTASAVFLGLGLARLLSVVVDGDPGTSFVVGIVGEFTFGCLSLFALSKAHRRG